MEKKIIVDVSPFVNYHFEKIGGFNAEISKKQWLKKDIGKVVVDYIKTAVDKHSFYTLNKAKFAFEIFDITTQNVILTIEWDEKDNLHIWTEKVKEDFRKLVEIFAYNTMVDWIQSS